MMFVSYDGSPYHGWQAQGNAISVQSVISETLSAVLGRETTVYASGRTDQSTMSREYWYLIKSAQDMLPFDDKRITPIKRLPGLNLLNDYASCIQGTHDFTTFASARDPSPSKFRDVYISEWDAINDLYGYSVLRYRVAGNAFLYHQVRSMVGTMLEAAMSGESQEDFRSRLESRDRKNALRTASSDGLYLADVSYDSEKYQWFEEQYGR